MQRMGPMMIAIYLVMMFLVGSSNGAAVNRSLITATAKPPPDNAAVFSRWFVNHSSWGVLMTVDGQGFPFGNVISSSDGGTGIPYFYLSKSCFTLSETALGTCGQADPQFPKCAKIALSGDVLRELVSVEEDSKEAAFAEAALFANHPQLSGWPKGHNFTVFKLRLKNIFLVNKLAPARYVPIDDYFKAI
ncbi:hypothetical protein DH2020_043522 [Rehmannia glutinosa]|uniref:CREG-like beta-barrel domain-containing protein n=1 Tax=Rehmannia glutinosa TaxID=99300 RepID=A0ABR0UJG4_REHGL